MPMEYLVSSTALWISSGCNTNVSKFSLIAQVIVVGINLLINLLCAVRKLGVNLFTF